jgi:hypothetical protein
MCPCQVKKASRARLFLDLFEAQAWQTHHLVPQTPYLHGFYAHSLFSFKKEKNALLAKAGRLFRESASKSS